MKNLKNYLIIKEYFLTIKKFFKSVNYQQIKKFNLVSSSKL